MNDLDDNLGQGVLYVSGTRGYSAYEIAVQNGFVGTEQEWLDSLVGPQGEPGTPFDELTEEQKAEIKGDEGKSAYEIAVENGFIGTEQDWVNSFINSMNYYNKDEIDNKIQDNYYDEITYTKERLYDTDCYFVNVPKNDSDGNTIDLYVDHVSNKPSLEYAETNFTTLTTNSSFSLVNTQGGTGGIPSVISNGEIIRTNDLKNVEGIADNYLYLGFKENREIAEYQVNAVTAQEMLDDGCLNVFNVYYKLIENGSALDLTDVVTAESGVVTNAHPRIALGVKFNGDILILACDGRTAVNTGLTSANMQTILLEKNCVDAWNLDGGGSTSVIIKGSKLNRNIDENGTEDRKRYYTLNVKKTTNNSDINKAFSKIGEEKQNIIQQIVPVLNKKLKWFRVTTSTSQSQIQHYMDVTGSKVIEFAKGNYTFNTYFILNADTTLILNNSVLTFSVKRGFRNHTSTDTFLEYKGNGNIAIIGGTIEGTSCSFCHGNNILFKDVYFLNCRNNHILEMMAIKDLVVDGCTFKGYNSNDLEKEYIQIDDPVYDNFPWFNSQDNPTYDNTPNKDWTIKNSNFLAPTDEGFEFGVAIGGHTNSLTNNVHHSNINIYQNYFEGYTYAAIRFRNVYNSRIYHNKFKNGVNASNLIDTIILQNSPDGIDIENNYVDCNGNTTFIFCNAPNANVTVSGNNVYNCTKENGDSYGNNRMMYFQQPKNLIIRNNLFYMISKPILFLSNANDTEETGQFVFINNYIRMSALNDECVIKLLSNASSYIAYNTFDVGVSNKYAIVLNSTMPRAYIKNNNMSASIRAYALDLNGYTGILTQIDNIYFQTYNGSSTYSDISSGTMTYDYTSFNTMVITCGTGNNTHHYKLRDFYPYNKLSERTYRLPSFDTSTDTVGVIDITLNSDKTFDYRSSNSVPLRAIYLINE